MILLTWYVKTGISNILYTPVRLGGLLISVVCSFTTPSFMSEMFSPALEWENYFERKVRHISCSLCSGHLLSLWSDPLRHGGLICNMHETGEASSGLSGHGFCPRSSICMSGHKTSLLFWDCIISPLYYFGSSSLCGEERKRGKCLAEQLHWRQEAEGIPAVVLVLTGKQMTIWKCVPSLVPAFRTLWAPFHYSNSIFRTLVLSASCKSFKYQFVSDERFCVYSLCGFP